MHREQNNKRKPCTIAFYVDDNKISHLDDDVITEVLDLLKGHFGDLTITRGNKQSFLGMDFEIKNKRVHVSMKKML